LIAVFDAQFVAVQVEVSGFAMDIGADRVLPKSAKIFLLFYLYLLVFV
jgi:hypothetical protein